MPNPQPVEEPETNPLPNPVLTVVPDPASDSPAENAEEKEQRGRIQWNFGEIQSLVAAAAKIMFEKAILKVPAIEDGWANREMMDYIRVAQAQVLPRERQRLAGGRQQFNPTLFVRIQQEIDLLQQKKLANAVAAPALVSPAPDIKVEPPAKKIDSIDQYIEDRISAAQQKLEEFVLDEFAKIEKRLDDLKMMITQRSPSQGYQKPEPSKKPLVAIIGFLPAQFENVVAHAKLKGIDVEFEHFEHGSVRRFTGGYGISHRFTEPAMVSRARLAYETGHLALQVNSVSAATLQLEAWFKE